MIKAFPKIWHLGDRIRTVTNDFYYLVPIGSEGEVLEVWGEDLVIKIYEFQDERPLFCDAKDVELINPTAPRRMNEIL
jgi:hypothetical protein